MIDTHSHILPYMDDGPMTIQEAVQMAEAAWKEGIRSIIATPHHADGKHINEREKICFAVAEINNHLSRLNLDIQVVPGQEIRMNRDLLTDLKSGNLVMLNEGNYILLELPHDSIPSYTHEMIHELRLLHLEPIIAHPERNLEIIKSPAKFSELIELGAIGQVTTQSLSGHYGKKAKETALYLCKSNLIHLIATDAHDLRYRPPFIQQALHLISGKVGPDFTKMLLQNAEFVLNHGPVIKREPELKRRWYLPFR
ncbi:tyrosine-protein phosphatase [Paenibacillus agricola]|uniref:Tyrosine-protein phosphatase n=1 Tax=Paenibacillus agricola TaxID=2716264 RepID=A0ABX0JK16_9BACL|nr:CpsB/CapC family capsule biosynthesis tyrosine phosphatase [Paenibacillus agricola]NHN34316.1 tyrosine protein phosphatase [Paenibacillus agricola]